MNRFIAAFKLLHKSIIDMKFEMTYQDCICRIKVWKGSNLICDVRSSNIDSCANIAAGKLMTWKEEHA